MVANVTTGSSELLGVLRARAGRGPTRVHLIIPATGAGGDREQATAALENALERFRSAGLEADGAIRAYDPFLAVTEAWDPRRYDELVISTLPMAESWLT